MSVLHIIDSRHSYRGKYKQISVPREDLTAIMKAGLAAPSGCNKQTTSLIAVDDPETLKKLRKVINPPAGETAPAIICVLTQRINAYRDRCFAVQDYSAAIENMLLALVELGYQSCWYEGHITDTDKIGEQMARILELVFIGFVRGFSSIILSMTRRIFAGGLVARQENSTQPAAKFAEKTCAISYEYMLLNVSDSYELVCFLPVGVPEEEIVSPKKRAFEERAWFNTFPDKRKSSSRETV